MGTEVGRHILSNPNSLGVVIGWFHEAVGADRALDELKASGFSEQQIDVERGTAPTRAMNGGLLGTIGRFLGIDRGKYQNFTDTMPHLGISEEQAIYLERHFKSGDEILTVGAGERSGEALAILERNGAETRFAVKDEDGYATDAPSPDSAESGLDNLDMARRSEEIERKIP